MKKPIAQLAPIFLVASQLSFGATFTVTNTEDKGFIREVHVWCDGDYRA